MLLVLAIVLAFVVLPSPLGLVVIVAAGVVEVGEVFIWKRWLSRYRIRAGAEALVGLPAVVIEDCAPRGRARIRGEIWNARSVTPLLAGAGAKVAGVEGLVLDLEPADADPLIASGSGRTV